MSGRIIAIGDIHGCSAALDVLLDAVALAPDDTLVTLGDYVDRGSDSRGVLERLIELESQCRLVPILGNHHELMLGAREGRSDLRFWMRCGGNAALDSYGAIDNLDRIPRQHFSFLERCRRHFETDSHFFVHTNYRPDLPLDQQDDHTLRWLSLRDFVPGPHCSGKIAVVGHTPQKEVLNLGHLIGLDTGCCYGGWLTALDVESGRTWQANERGELRDV